MIGKNKKDNTLAAQDFLGILDIREGAIILKDRSLRGLLYVTSQNFGLKSAEEQDAIIFQFQQFLNSLDFPCQIVIQSRKLNMQRYFDDLKSLEKDQQNPLLKVQMQEYITFIEGLVKSGTIMTKNFFVSVPFYLTEISGIPVEKKFINELTEESFQRAKNQLWQRLEFIALGLKRCGLQAAALSTEEIIDLLWSLYHTREAEQGYYPELPPELIK
jgi:hypothetical protein